MKTLLLFLTIVAINYVFCSPIENRSSGEDDTLIDTELVRKLLELNLDDAESTLNKTGLKSLNVNGEWDVVKNIKKIIVSYNISKF